MPRGRRGPWPPPQRHSKTQGHRVSLNHLLYRPSRVERVEPALHLGELGKSPHGTVLHERQRRPDDPVGVPRLFGRVEQHLELGSRREPPPRRRHRLPVALEDPRPLLRREPEEEGGPFSYDLSTFLFRFPPPPPPAGSTRGSAAAAPAGTGRGKGAGRTGRS